MVSIFVFFVLIWAEQALGLDNDPDHWDYKGGQECEIQHQTNLHWLLAGDPFQRRIYQAFFSDWLLEHSIAIASNDEYMYRLQVSHLHYLISIFFNIIRITITI
jgi:hypothetical protein